MREELQGAFDDLDDDNEASLSQNLTNHSPYEINHNKNRFENNPIFDDFTANHKPNVLHANINQDRDLINEIRNLKIEMASKTEEVKNIKAHCSRERDRYENKIDELRKRLAITEADKERAHMSRKQTHELFVESKQKLSDREEQIAELNGKIKLLDTRNLELMTELEHTKSLLNDVQHKYQMIERNSHFKSDNHVKQINDKYIAQMDVLQQQVNLLQTKLDDRENELKRLMIQNNELQKSREAILLDKSDSLNQLSKRLEDSQRQCQNLILKNGIDSNSTQENLKLSRAVAALERRTDEMQRTIDDLNSQ